LDRFAFIADDVDEFDLFSDLLSAHTKKLQRASLLSLVPTGRAHVLSSINNRQSTTLLVPE